MVDLKDVYNTLKELMGLTREIKEHTRQIDNLEQNQELILSKLDTLSTDVKIIKERLDVWGEISRIKENLAEIQEKLKT